MKKITAVLLILSFGLFLLSGCTTNVTNKNVTISLQNNSYSGQYSGAWDNNKPSGEGTFIYSDNTVNIHYFGNFENGEIKGKGSLISTTLTIKLTLDGTSGDHIGTYTGDTVDGIPSGKGKFSTAINSGKCYSYIGEWLNGLMNGQGELTYENADNSIANLSGTFTNGVYAPTLRDFLVKLGSNSVFPFSITDKAESFLISHSDLFPANNSQDIQQYIDTSFDLQNFLNAPQDYGDKMNQLSQLSVEKIESYQKYGKDFTALYLNENGIFKYLCIYPGIYDLKMGDQVTVFGIPAASASITSMDGFKVCIFATSYIK